MADQVNIMDASIPETTDPTNGYQYIVKSGIDYRIANSNLYKNVLRSKMSETCNGTVGQVITYSSAFLSLQPLVIDYQGIGIEVTDFDENGFTITSLGSGNFAYLTIVEV